MSEKTYAEALTGVLVDEPVVPVRKNPKQPSRRSVAKFNVVELSSEKPEPRAFVLVKETRRYKYGIFLAVFVELVKIALRENKYTIRHNNYSREIPKHLHRLRSATGNMLIHGSETSIVVRLPITWGPDASQVKDLDVDIMGACIDAARTLAYKQDAELQSLVRRAMALHSGQTPCLNARCLETFDSSILPNPHVQCVLCDTEQCIRCRVAWEAHAGKSCLMIQATSSAVLDDTAIKNALYIGEMQPCPKCGIFSVKIEGCNMMRCENVGCGDSWCWACGQGELRRTHYDPHDHFYDYACPVASEMFERSDAISQAIRQRNLTNFGDRIRPNYAPAVEVARVEVARVPRDRTQEEEDAEYARVIDASLRDELFRRFDENINRRFEDVMYF